MKTLKVLITSGLLLLTGTLVAQYSVFNIPQNASLVRNPAFTGGDSALAVGVSYWRLPGSYYRQTLSSGFVTAYLSPLKGHVGITFLQDNLSGADKDLLTSYSSLKLSYAQDIKLGESGLLKIGASGGVLRSLLSLDYSLADMYYVPNSQNTYFDAALGASFHYKALTLATSIEHFGNRNFKQEPGVYRLHPMQNYYASYSVALNEQFSIEPYFTFRKERWTYERIELGELLRYKKFSTGFGLFGENGGGPLSYSFLFGYQTDRFRALFGTASFPSYISTRSTNSYEISFRWKVLKMTGNNLVKPTSIFLS